MNNDRPFEKILAATPINRMAGRVTRRGVQPIEIKHNPSQIPSEGRPETIPFYGPSKLNHTGKKFGALTVIGYLTKNRWAVRCDCGRYESRKARTFNGLNLAVEPKKHLSKYFCDLCEKVERLKTRKYCELHAVRYNEYCQKCDPARLEADQRRTGKLKIAPPPPPKVRDDRGLFVSKSQPPLERPTLQSQGRHLVALKVLKSWLDRCLVDVQGDGNFVSSVTELDHDRMLVLVSMSRPITDLEDAWRDRWSTTY